ncbi:MAG: PepSY domain-containing protein [Rhodocyclales bacterium GT-UBC]|nr:MAG: PepSY domain-containing protein [Rhodocyclales bacterium GT-UBC]
MSYPPVPPARLRRGLFITLHRWFGLSAALFLFVAGLTGAIIAWHDELDARLNPQLFRTETHAQTLSPLRLAAALETVDPRLRVRYLPLSIEPGHSLQVMVEPRLDPVTGQPHDLGFNQLMLDPATSRILGKREWGKASLHPENLLPFLYTLHYSLHIPDAFGLPLGPLLMGSIAIVWVVDTLLALGLSFPSPRHWRRTFALRRKAGGHRLSFDLHRAGGVWFFLLLLMLAITSVAMSFREQAVLPLRTTVSPLTPPVVKRVLAAEPRLGFDDILPLALAEADRRGWTSPPGGIFVANELGVYGVGFFTPGKDHDAAGRGHPWLYFDSQDGTLLGAELPGQGSIGQRFLQAAFPLHAGRIIGLPGRILISLSGLAIAALSLTGLLIWARKRRTRTLQAQRRRPGKPPLEALPASRGA